MAMLVAALVLSVALGLAVFKPGTPGERTSGIPTGLIVLGSVAIGCVVWFLRRSGTGARRDGGRLKCLDRIRLQPGRDLHLVEAEGVRLLVSSGENGVQLVTRLEPAPVDTVQEGT
jgi:hypothetical protein